MTLFKFNLNKIATLRAALKKAKEEAEYYKTANAKLVRENFDLRVELSKFKPRTNCTTGCCKPLK